MTIMNLLLAAALAVPSPGAAGIGDPYFPTAGNGGYDVASYDIDVRYQPATDELTGTTKLVARATQDLSRFDLDFALKASRVTVNGTPAVNVANAQELVITPDHPLRKGALFTVSVTYSGIPSTVKVDGVSAWTRTRTGAVAAGEPAIAQWWFPSNDHPRDKAAFRTTMTVPAGIQAISNGNLSSTRTVRGWTTYRWTEPLPQATYLAFLAIGKYDVESGNTASGLPYTYAFAQGDSAVNRQARVDIRRTGEVVDWLAQQWGPYPFDAVGGVLMEDKNDLALENQTRPTYPEVFWEPVEPGQPVESAIGLIVHENAHQWFGDSVSLKNWRDIWLNEGFAVFSGQLWEEAHGGETGQQYFDELCGYFPPESNFWTTVVADPGADKVLGPSAYTRGFMTLQALRNRIGDATVRQVIRAWVAQNRYGNGSTEDFIALANRVSGKDLDGFFQAWLYASTAPSPTEYNGCAPGAPRARSAMPDFSRKF